MNQQVVLAEVPDASGGERLLVTLHSNPDEGSRIVLSQQSYSERVGWYNQHSLELDPEQVRQLRAALGSGSLPAMPPGEAPATIKFSGAKAATA